MLFLLPAPPRGTYDGCVEDRRFGASDGRDHIGQILVAENDRGDLKPVRDVECLYCQFERFLDRSRAYTARATRPDRRVVPDRDRPVRSGWAIRSRARGVGR